MFFKNIIIGCRLIKSKLSNTLISTIGMSIAYAAILIIYIWIIDETSYDRFHENFNQLYRIEQDQLYNGRQFHVISTPYPAAELWKEKNPEIIDIIRIAYCGSLLVKHQESTFYEDGIRAVDSVFFRLFDFPFLMGDPNNSLTMPNSIIITQQMAIKYFGNTNPIGKDLILDNNYVFQVTGVLKPIPQNSTIWFDFLVPIDFTKQLGFYSDNWKNNLVQTFALFHEGVNKEHVNNQLTEIAKERIQSQDVEFIQYPNIRLNPLNRLHIYTVFGYGDSPNVLSRLRLFIYIGLMILLLVTITYTNLTTVKSYKRIMEVGLRKVFGSSKLQIAKQFLTESIPSVLIIVLMSFILVICVLEPIRTNLGIELESINRFNIIFPLIIGIFIWILLFSVLYPATFMAYYKSSNLNNLVYTKFKTWILRRIIIFIQISVSIILIFMTLVIIRQNNYLRNKPLGYNPDKVMYIELFGDLTKKYEIIKNVFLNFPEVSMISGGTQPPHYISTNTNRIDWDGKPDDYRPLVHHNRVDLSFLELLEIEIQSGRTFFSNSLINLTNNYDSIFSNKHFIVNKSFVKLFGTDSIINKPVEIMGDKGKIVGIMRDFHCLSLHSNIPPLAITTGQKTDFHYMLIKLKTTSTNNIIKKMEKAWMGKIPEYPFEYSFISDDLNLLYRSDRSIGILILIFALIAIALSCSGLISLADHFSQNRTKEAAIRKVLGCSKSHLIKLFLWPFTKIFIISSLVSIPILIITKQSLLNNYPYRCSIPAIIYIIPFIGVLVLILLCVINRAYKIAQTKISNTLKYQ